jgi:DHA1 family tetracycline resistance protein-like MFS transporter
MKPGRAAFAFVYVTVALDMLALGVMIPVLPKLIIQLEGGDLASAARVSGLFALGWAAMQFVAAPVLGALSDHFGRRPVILLSNLGLGLDYLLMAVAPSLPWLFLGRIVSGVTAASFPTAGAYVADVTPADERAARFGLLGSAFGLGFIIGPAVGGLLGGIDLRLPFWVAAGLSLLNFAYGLFVLPESLPIERRSPFRWRLANPVGSLGFLRAHPGMLGFAAANGLGYIAHDALPAVFVLYADHRYGWDETTIGLVLAAVGVCSTIVSVGLVGPVVKRLGERATILGGLALGTIGFAIYGGAPTGALFCVGVPFTALWGLGGPAMSALMSRSVGPSAQGQLQGALGSLQGLAGMFAPVLYTQILAATVGETATLPLPGAPFLLAAALLAGSLAVMWRVTGGAGAVAAEVTID